MMLDDGGMYCVSPDAQSSLHAETNKHRRQLIRHKESVKQGCGYRLSWLEVQVSGETVAAVWVKNKGLHVEDGESVILHGPGSGTSAHLGQVLTPECKQFVHDLLDMGLRGDAIYERAFKFKPPYHWTR